jgi:hypothetical protein
VDESLWTERTMLLNFSGGHGLVRWHRRRHEFVTHTEVHLHSTTGVEAQCSITCGTLLGLEFADVFVKACFVADVAAAQLQDALAAQCVLEALFTHAALHVDICALAAGPRPLNVHDAGHASGRVRRRVRVEGGGAAGGEGLGGAGRRTARAGTQS